MKSAFVLFLVIGAVVVVVALVIFIRMLRSYLGFLKNHGKIGRNGE